MAAFRLSRLLAAPLAVLTGALAALGDPTPWAVSLVVRVALAAFLLQAGSRALLRRAEGTGAAGRGTAGGRGIADARGMVRGPGGAAGSPAGAAPGPLSAVGVALLGAGVWVGLPAVEARGWFLLWIGAAGLFAGIVYSRGPALRDRALGEPLAFLLFGPLPVLAGYVAAAGHASFTALALSVPPGLLATACALAASRRDLARDRERRATSWATVFSPPAADRLFLILLAASYAWVGLGCWRGFFPWPLLATLLTLPLAGRAYAAFRLAGRGERSEEAPVADRAVALYLAFAASLATGWILAAELAPPVT